MSAQHTPGPWEVIHQHGLLDIVVNREEAVVICTSVTPANARRIVACVNACAGVTDNDLDLIAKGGGFEQITTAWSCTLRDMEQQRDELLAAADRFADIMADKDRQLIAVARQRGEMLNALIAARNLVIDKFSCKSDVIKLLQDGIENAKGQK